MTVIHEKRVETAATVPTQSTNPLGGSMSYSHGSNTDLLDRLVDAPLPIGEAAKALSFYLPHVAAQSPGDAWKSQFLIARLHCGAAIGRSLDASVFTEAAWVGEEIYCRRRGELGASAFEDWTNEQLNVELSTLIDQLLGGTE